MRIYIKPLLAIIAIVCPIYLNAQTTLTSTPHTTQGTTLLKKPKSNTKPKVPSYCWINFNYDSLNDKGYFDLRHSGVTSVMVDINKKMSDYHYKEHVTVTESTIYLHLESSTYTITCTAEDGSTFQGEMIIE